MLKLNSLRTFNTAITSAFSISWYLVDKLLWLKNFLKYATFHTLWIQTKKKPKQKLSRFLTYVLGWTAYKCKFCKYIFIHFILRIQRKMIWINVRYSYIYVCVPCLAKRALFFLKNLVLASTRSTWLFLYSPTNTCDWYNLCHTIKNYVIEQSSMPLAAYQ